MKKHEMKIAILKVLLYKELHGYDIRRQLSIRGVSSQLSYIYQVLSEMRKEGLIKSIWLKGPNGLKRKVYSLDTSGLQELQAVCKNLVDSVHEFYIDYLARLPPEKWILKWEKMITDIIQTAENKTIIFIAAKPYALKAYQYALEYTSDKTGRDVYLITDKSIDFNLNLNNLVIMNGKHTDIPLKRDFADAVIACDPPKPGALLEAVAEFHRVVKKGGVVAMGYPNIEEQEDPLTIGAFIERIQYGLEKSDFPDEKALTSAFKKYFNITKTTKAGDFTFFLGIEKLPEI